MARDIRTMPRYDSVEPHPATAYSGRHEVRPFHLAEKRRMKTANAWRFVLAVPVPSAK